MAARLKLEGIDERAPPEVESLGQFDLTLEAHQVLTLPRSPSLAHPPSLTQRTHLRVLERMNIHLYLHGCVPETITIGALS